MKNKTLVLSLFILITGCSTNIINQENQISNVKTSPTPSNNLISDNKPVSSIESSLVPTILNTPLPSATPSNNLISDSKSVSKSYIINENSKKVFQELQNSISNVYISGANIDENGNILLSTINNDLYKISGFSNFELHQSGTSRPNSPYQSELRENSILIDDSGNGVLLKSDSTQPCPDQEGAYCLLSGPSIYKIKNYKFEDNIKLNSYKYNRGDSNRSVPVLSYTEPNNGKGRLLYIDYKNNSVVVSEVTKYNQIGPEKEIKITDPDVVIRHFYSNKKNEYYLLGFNTKINRYYHYNILNNNSLDLIFIYNAQNKLTQDVLVNYYHGGIDNYHNKIDKNGNGTIEISEPVENRINKISIYKVENNKVDTDNKKEVKIPSSIDIYNYKKLISDENGNGMFLYNDSNTPSLLLNIWKLTNWEIKEKISSTENGEFVLNSSGDGIFYKNNSSNDVPFKFVSSEVSLVNNYQIVSNK